MRTIAFAAIITAASGCASYSLRTETRPDGTSIVKEDAIAFLSGDIKAKRDGKANDLDIHKESKMADVLAAFAPFIPFLANLIGFSDTNVVATVPVPSPP